jgi:Zn-finger protein
MPSFGSFGQTVSEEKNLKNQPIRNKNCLWWPCLLTDRDGMGNLYRGPSINASYQVSYHVAKRFQRKSCFRNRPIRNKNCLWWPCLLTNQNRMSNSHGGPSIDASYHVSVHLAKLFQSRRFFRNWPIRNKNCLWWPCLLMDWDKMSNLYREPSIDASY